MKKLFPCLLLLLVNRTDAQIRIEKIHMIETSRTVVISTDTVKRSIPVQGKNAQWNYSALKSVSKDSLRFGLAEWYPGYNYFPEANRTYIHSGTPDSFHYQLLNDTALYNIGLVYMTGGNPDAFRNKLKILSFPSEYGTSFQDRHAVIGNALPVEEDIDTAGPLPYIDSLRIADIFTTVSQMTGEGSAITPLGTFNCLQQTLSFISSQEAQILSGGQWQAASEKVEKYFGLMLAEPFITVYKKFWVPGAHIGVPLIECNYLPGDATIHELRWVSVISHANSIDNSAIKNIHLYPNPSNGRIQFGSVFKGQIKLFGNDGQWLINEAEFEGEGLDITDLPAAIYVLELIDDEGHTFRYKIIKN